MASPESRRNIFAKAAVKAAGFTVAPLILAASGCSVPPILDLKIPGCDSSPQSQLNTVVLLENETLKIDNVYFTLGNNGYGVFDKIYLNQNDQPADHRSSTLTKDYWEFLDTKNGRVYHISKDPSRTNDTRATLVVQADCEAPKTNS